MTKHIHTSNTEPTREKQRYIILDVLRGLALFTIIIANFPEFGLWTFLSSEALQMMPTADTDSIIRYLQYFLIDGKGYTLFSLLFGCGFSIILEHTFGQGANGILLFYRRMVVLLMIALCHLLFIWSGDILCLYAVLGMVLPLFHKLSDKGLLWSAGILLFIPVMLDFFQQMTGIRLAAPVEQAWWAKANSYGITESNFATWLRDADSYGAVFQFLTQGAIERMWEFVDGNRLFKVLGLFVLGYAIGRNKLYARLDELRPCIIYLCRWSGIIGVPFSLLYAWHAVSGHPWESGIHSTLYFVSVVPMTFFYLTGICLLFLRHPEHIIFRIFAKTGRMALTNYICQSIIGVIIYYGIGFGLGLSQGLYQIELMAIAVFCLQILFCTLWLKWMKFGPLEWIWRMMTYGRWLNPIL